MPHTVIRVENVGKRYRIGGGERFNTLRDTIAHGVRSVFAQSGGRSGDAPRTIWALRDVSFTVEQGEVVGLIGANGSGKSTLLKVLARITRPTTGSGEIHGRLGSLLEVGTGFHGELSGRENIYLSGAILGMNRRDIDRKFDEIVAFSEVKDFIETPVKHYSSGMYVRLAFAVAAHLEPDILLVDEVLAVGDTGFQRKCLAKMREVAYEGRTVLFVSHDLAAVQALTGRSLLLQRGRVAAYGPSEAVIQQYLTSTIDTGSGVYEVEAAPRRIAHLPQHVHLVRVELEGGPMSMIRSETPLTILATVRGKRAVESFRVVVTVFRLSGSAVGTCLGPEVLCIASGETATFRIELPQLRLAPGAYHCAVSAQWRTRERTYDDLDIVFDVLHFEVGAGTDLDAVSDLWNPSWGGIRFDPPKIERVR